MVADSLSVAGVIVDHDPAATSHFKVTHDGIGGVTKNIMRRAELNTDMPVRIHDARAAYDFLKEHMDQRAVEDSEAPYATWSPYKVRQTHVVWVPYGSIRRPSVTLEPVVGTRQLCQLWEGFHSRTET